MQIRNLQSWFPVKEFFAFLGTGWLLYAVRAIMDGETLQLLVNSLLCISSYLVAYNSTPVRNWRLRLLVIAVASIILLLGVYDMFLVS